MPNTYAQITTHAVSAVKYRENFLNKDWWDNLHNHVAGIITNKWATLLAAGGWQYHVHILIGVPATKSIADFFGAVKANSS